MLADVRADLLEAQGEREWRATHMAELDGHLYLMSATAISEHEDRATLDIATVPLIIIGTRMDKYFFDALETNYLIENIRPGPPAWKALCRFWTAPDMSSVSWSGARPSLAFNPCASP